MQSVSAVGKRSLMKAVLTFQYDGFGNLTAKVLNATTTPIPVNAATGDSRAASECIALAKA